MYMLDLNFTWCGFNLRKILKEETMEFVNAYEDSKKAEAYSKLEFPGTYYLAFRDLPEILGKHVKGKNALDFGCGTGRSTRFLQKVGFKVTGVDISKPMLKRAREMDPRGNYRLIKEGQLRKFEKETYDLILSAFTFDNIPFMERKVDIFSDLNTLLSKEGTLINLVSTPEMYTHEWMSFSTRDFPENHRARSGDIVKIITTELEDNRPVDDILWTDRDYRKTYQESNLEIVETHRPLANGNEPYLWINETRIPPWCIYVLKKIPV
jgi:ubiquinone/menaquinone biosynthesis C-methylase UbiE